MDAEGRGPEPERTITSSSTPMNGLGRYSIVHSASASQPASHRRDGRTVAGRRGGQPSLRAKPRSSCLANGRLFILLWLSFTETLLKRG